MLFDAQDLQNRDELFEALGQRIVQALFHAGQQADLDALPDAGRLRCYSGVILDLLALLRSAWFGRETVHQGALILLTSPFLKSPQYPSVK